MVLALDAVYNKNTLQFVFLAFFNFSLIIYGAIQIVEVQSNVDALVLAGASLPAISVRVLTVLVPICVAIAEVAYIGLGWQIWKEFGWKVYKFLGADRTIKKIYAHYQVFQCLLKFDIFFWAGFSLQWITLVLVDKSDFEYYATIVALPLSILLLIEGYLAARHENRWMMGSFMVGCIAGCAYFGYKVCTILGCHLPSADFSTRRPTEFCSRKTTQTLNTCGNRSSFLVRSCVLYGDLEPQTDKRSSYQLCCPSFSS